MEAKAKIKSNKSEEYQHLHFLQPLQQTRSQMIQSYHKKNFVESQDESEFQLYSHRQLHKSQFDSNLSQRGEMLSEKLTLGIKIPNKFQQIKSSKSSLNPKIILPQLQNLDYDNFKSSKLSKASYLSKQRLSISPKKIYKLAKDYINKKDFENKTTKIKINISIKRNKSIEDKKLKEQNIPTITSESPNQIKPPRLPYINKKISQEITQEINQKNNTLENSPKRTSKKLDLDKKVLKSFLSLKKEKKDILQLMESQSNKRAQKSLSPNVFTKSLDQLGLNFNDQQNEKLPKIIDERTKKNRIIPKNEFILSSG